MKIPQVVCLVASLVAVCRALSSPDPLDTWTPLQSGTTDSIMGMAYGNGIFVTATGNGLFASPDGSAWTMKAGGTYSSIAFGNGVFVAFGSQASFASTNGTNWTETTAPVSGLYGLTFANGIFIGVGLNGVIASSTNGIGWTKRSSTTSNSLWAVTYGNGNYIAVGGDSFGSTIVRSPNGSDWSQVTVPVGLSLEYLECAVYGNGLFIAGTQTGQLIASSDGINWLLVDSESTMGFFGLAYGSGTYVGVGHRGGIVTSADGQTWIHRVSGVNDILYGITYATERFFAFGLPGTLLESGRFVTYRGPVITEQPTNEVALAGETAKFSLKMGGDVPFTFQWQKDGTPIVSGTNADLILENVQPSAAGAYSVTVGNSFGITNSQMAILSVQEIQVLTNGSLVGGSTITITGSAMLELRSMYPNGSMFFTLDGSEPDFSTAPYQGPFQVTQTGVLKVIAYSADFSKSVVSDPYQLVILPTFNLTTSVAGGGLILIDNPGPYVSNSVVTVTEWVLPGWSFMNWSGAASGSSDTNSIRMTQDQTVGAVFGTTISTTTIAGGKIVLTPDAPVYPYGASVRITAVPDSGKYFGVWGINATGSQNPLILTVTNATPLISALFAPLAASQATLTVTSDGGGHVDVAPAANRYPIGTTNTLTAVPEPGQDFLGWAGDANGNANPLSLVMDTSKVVTAKFSHQSKLTITHAQGDAIQLTLAGAHGDVFRIDATSDLRVWSSLLAMTNFFDFSQFTDPAIAASSLRFYRAVSVP